MAYPTTTQTSNAWTSAASDRHGTLRLDPIERPRGILLPLAYKVSRKQFGKVPTALKVVYPRVPGLVKLVRALHKFDKTLRLEKELTVLVHTQVSAVNGCGFCMDLARMMVIKKDLMPLDKINALPQYKTSALFTDRERAAIAYADEVTRSKKPSDQTFETLRHHFSDQEIAELTVQIALEHFMNLINVPLGIQSDGLCAIAQAKGQ